jgi:hypothetical protein
MGGEYSHVLHIGNTQLIFFWVNLVYGGIRLLEIKQVTLKSKMDNINR